MPPRAFPRDSACVEKERETEPDVSTATLSAGTRRAAVAEPATGQAWSVLAVSTLSFTVCFMVWMMFGVIGIPIRKMLNLNATEFGLLTAMPVLTGSLVRVPLGIWTDRFGGRVVMAVLMAVDGAGDLAHVVRHAYWHFLLIGLFVGLAGGSFSVGTPYVARWFPKSRQGFAMGVYGAGNSGAAVNKFVAPVILVALGWQAVPQVYAAVMLGTVLLFWFFSYSDPRTWCPARSPSATSSRRSRTRRCCATASTTASCSAATSRCRCGWCSTTSASSASTSAWRPCWPRASRCPAACCAPSAAGSRTSTARTA
jgi:predicted MFS family arabinose efflux permease